jgi:hypothetical protein
MVVFQQPAEPFATLDRSFTLSGMAWSGKEQSIALPLMGAFPMKMSHILCEGMTQGSFPTLDQP